MPQEPNIREKRSWPLRATLAPESPLYKWWIMIALMSGVLTNSLIMGTVNIALPKMMTTLRVNVETVQWVVTVFMITRTVTMPLVGWLGTLLGNRALYLSSLGLYVIASFLCSISWSIESLIFFRFLQGIGAGPLFPMAMAILYETFPSEQRGLSMGVLMFGLSFGPAIGPSVGGYLIEYLSWRAIFYINIPAGLVGLLLAGMLLPKTQRAKSVSLDALGLLSLTLCLVPLLLALSQGRREGWTSEYILTLLGIAILSLIVFVFVELHTANPLIDLSVFRRLSFAMVCLVTSLNSMANFGLNFLTALFVQQALHYPPALAGLILLPGAIVWGITSLFSGRLSDIVEPRIIVVSGLVFSAMVAYFFTFTNPWTSTSLLVGLLVLRSFTRGCILSPLMNAFVSNLPSDKVRMGTGLRGLLNGVGGTFGVAAIGALLERRQIVHAIAYGEDQQLYPLGTAEMTSRVQHYLLQSGEAGLLPRKTASILHTRLMEEATLTAYHDCFLTIALLSLSTVLPTLLIRRSLPSAPSSQSKDPTETKT
ncbi:MAG: DHA2 family efflux MFS transporter permease subunit [Nitrospinota bacterium]|nr:MAG: DHA2 family efflux MFS transporter permease subunit [Nitrospinota bacterium]